MHGPLPKEIRDRLRKGRSSKARWGGFLRRTLAMAIKEFHQLRRDRVSIVLMLLAPAAQTLLYGYAINTTPRHLPTAVLVQEQTDLGRSVVKSLENSGFFDFTQRAQTEAEVSQLIESGKVQFAVEIPYGFERALRRGEQAKLLVIADATDPIATNAAMGAITTTMQGAFKHDRGIPPGPDALLDVRVHARYNPEGINAFNIVPGLIGTILSMTMVVFTALSVKRELERGTMEGLLSKPLNPIEIMLGKIIPYIGIGLGQAAVIVVIGLVLFGVPVLGNMVSLAFATLIFILSNLAIGYFFSTVAGTQLQALQLTSVYILPNMLLSGFMFPIAGFPKWAQSASEILPLTHFLRILRGLMLKGVTLDTLHTELIALLALLVFTTAVALLRFRTTLD